MDFNGVMQVLTLTAGIVVAVKGARDSRRKRKSKKSDAEASIFGAFEADPVVENVMTMLEASPVTIVIAVLADQAPRSIDFPDIVRALDSAGSKAIVRGSLDDGIARSFEHTLIRLGELNRQLEDGRTTAGELRTHLSHWAHLLGEDGPPPIVVRSIAAFIRRGEYTDAAELIWKLRAG